MLHAPTAEERHAVREYCLATRDLEAARLPFQRDKRRLSARKKSARDELYRSMQRSGHECCKVEGAGGVGYVQRRTYANRRAVTAAVIAEALAELSADDRATGNEDTFVDAVVRSIAGARVVRKDFVAVRKTKPRTGVAEAASPAVAAAARDFQEADRSLSACAAAQKEAEEDFVEKLKAVETRVNEFMNRANLTAQRVNVNNTHARTVQTYFIRRKTTQRRPRLSADDIKNAVAQAVRALRGEAPFRGGNALLSRSDAFVGEVLKALAAIPSIYSARITLDRGALKRAEPDA